MPSRRAILWKNRQVSCKVAGGAPSHGQSRPLVKRPFCLGKTESVGVGALSLFPINTKPSNLRLRAAFLVRVKMSLPLREIVAQWPLPATGLHMSESLHALHLARHIGRNWLSHPHYPKSKSAQKKESKCNENRYFQRRLEEFLRGWGLGAGRKIVQKRCFSWETA